MNYYNFIHLVSFMLWFWLNFVLFAIEIRMILQWFLIVNPYTRNLRKLWIFTSPSFYFGRKAYPRIFGIDFTPIVNSKILSNVIRHLEPFALNK
jgi:uncharacterized protein YggT (Ycf19 family)